MTDPIVFFSDTNVVCVPSNYRSESNPRELPITVTISPPNGILPTSSCFNVPPTFRDRLANAKKICIPPSTAEYVDNIEVREGDLYIPVLLLAELIARQNVPLPRALQIALALREKWEQTHVNLSRFVRKEDFGDALYNGLCGHSQAESQIAEVLSDHGIGHAEEHYTDTLADLWLDWIAGPLNDCGPTHPHILAVVAALQAFADEMQSPQRPTNAEQSFVNASAPLTTSPGEILNEISLLMPQLTALQDLLRDAIALAGQQRQYQKSLEILQPMKDMLDLALTQFRARNLMITAEHRTIVMPDTAALKQLRESLRQIGQLCQTLGLGEKTQGSGTLAMDTAKTQILEKLQGQFLTGLQRAIINFNLAVERCNRAIAAAQQSAAAATTVSVAQALRILSTSLRQTTNSAASATAQGVRRGITYARQLPKSHPYLTGAAIGVGIGIAILGGLYYLKTRNK